MPMLFALQAAPMPKKALKQEVEDCLDEAGKEKKAHPEYQSRSVLVTGPVESCDASVSAAIFFTGAHVWVAWEGDQGFHTSLHEAGRHMHKRHAEMGPFSAGVNFVGRSLIVGLLPKFSAQKSFCAMWQDCDDGAHLRGRLICPLSPTISPISTIFPLPPPPCFPTSPSLFSPSPLPKGCR